MVRLGTLLLPVLYLSVILGSALMVTASASVTGTMLQSIAADPGGAAQIRPLVTVHVPAAPAGRVPVPLTPLPAPQEASLVALAPAPDAAAIDPTAPLFVVSSGVNVRAAASKSAERLSSLESGETVSVVDRSGHWVKVARDGVVLGWVYDRYLKAID